MRRLILISAAALVFAACSDSPEVVNTTVPAATDATVATQNSLPADGVAATVDGETITVDEVLAMSVANSTPAETADTLRRLIVNRVLEASIAELGIEITPEMEADARTQIVDEVVGASGATLEEVLEASSLNEAAFALIVRQSALADAVEKYLEDVAPAPRDQDIQELYNEQVLSIANVCTSHILLDTEPEAQAALDRVLAGEDFAALAQERSTGPSGPGGGSIGCSNPSGYVTAYAEASMVAELNVAYGPVQTEFGFHVILVTERTAPTLDEMREDLTAELLAQVFPVWLTTEIQAADVVVAPEFGVWQNEPAPVVVPPQ